MMDIRRQRGLEETKKQLGALVTDSARIRYDIMRAFGNSDEQKRLRAQVEEIDQQIPEIYSALVYQYIQQGKVSIVAEMAASRDYASFRDKAAQRYKRSRHTPAEMNDWLTQTTFKVIEVLRARNAEFKEMQPPEGVDETALSKFQFKQRRTDFIGELLNRHDQAANPNRSELHRIIKGYLCEFINQTESGLPACNIMNGRNPEAQEYWKSRPSEEFEAAKAPGIFHAAATYNKLKSLRSERKHKKIAWESTGEIIRHSIDVFKQEYPRFDTEHVTTASLFNDHLEIIARSTQLNQPSLNV